MKPKGCHRVAASSIDLRDLLIFTGEPRPDRRNERVSAEPDAPGWAGWRGRRIKKARRASALSNGQRRRERGRP